MMKVLVTGTAGFIGSHAAMRLLKRGGEVVGIDNLSDYYGVDLIGNEQPVELLRHIEVLEQRLGKKATMELLPLQGVTYRMPRRTCWHWLETPDMCIGRVLEVFQ